MQIKRTFTCMFGIFDLPDYLYFRALRLDRKFPGMYKGGYLNKYFEYQYKTVRL